MAINISSAIEDLTLMLQLSFDLLKIDKLLHILLFVTTLCLAEIGHCHRMHYALKQQFSEEQNNNTQY
ncbi:hypothetical protein SPONN_27 [uncultured Candidatus Thioglobus sp.]|nr:hypothetical protein SPONN_27 [uncultured Candidatus Thioglobus sp.]